LAQKFRTLIGLLFIGEMTSLAYIGGIAEIAALTGIAYILFPELAALAYDIFTRPRGTWAKAPVMLIVTPLLTAIIGILIEQNLGYSVVSVLLAISSALLVIKLLNSPVAPAISAGLLPIVLEEKSWLYPASIILGTSLLVLSLFIYRKVFSTFIDKTTNLADVIDDIVEQPPRQYSWLPFFVIFLLTDIYLAKLTGLRLIIFPPLIVIAFEMFAHSDVCPWAGKPVLLVLACMLTAAVGVSVVLALGNTPLAVIIAIAFAMGINRAFSLHAPPAVAVGLLPFVISQPDFWFPLAVGTGTSLLAGTFIIYRTFVLQKNTQA
jgi:CBS-domain-containing membrane protein